MSPPILFFLAAWLPKLAVILKYAAYVEQKKKPFPLPPTPVTFNQEEIKSRKPQTDSFAELITFQNVSVLKSANSVGLRGCGEKLPCYI